MRIFIDIIEDEPKAAGIGAVVLAIIGFVLVSKFFGWLFEPGCGYRIVLLLGIVCFIIAGIIWLIFHDDFVRGWRAYQDANPDSHKAARNGGLLILGIILMAFLTYGVLPLVATSGRNCDGAPTERTRFGPAALPDEMFAVKTSLLLLV